MIVSKVDTILGSFPPSYFLFYINYIMSGMNLSLDGLISSLKVVEKIVKECTTRDIHLVTSSSSEPKQKGKKINKKKV